MVFRMANMSGESKGVKKAHFEGDADFLQILIVELGFDHRQSGSREALFLGNSI